MSYSTDINGILNKSFSSNYIYTISSASQSSSGINGVFSYSGSVAGFGASSVNGTVTAGNTTSGTFTLGGTAYQVLGTSSDGNYLIFGYANSGSAVPASFVLSNSGAIPTGSISYQTSNGYNAITPTCFAQGTLIATPTEEVAVEQLEVGDLVSTSGGPRAIKWLGRRELALRGSPWPECVNPVTIAPHAFGPGRPNRPLTLSPGHGIVINCVDKVLIPVGQLVNGATIVQHEASSIVYWHVELEEHSVILSHGLETETYLDVGNRHAFEGGGVLALHPVFDGDGDGSCYPRVADGPILHAVRDRINKRAEALGWRISSEKPNFALIVDEVTIAPMRAGGAARFLVPASARSITLTCDTMVPKHVYSGSMDRRALGLKVYEIVSDDGLGSVSAINLEDVSYSDGFHDLEEDGRGKFRWTSGRCVLPPSLWERCKSEFFLKLTFEDRSCLTWLPLTSSERRETRPAHAA